MGLALLKVICALFGDYCFNATKIHWFEQKDAAAVKCFLSSIDLGPHDSSAAAASIPQNYQKYLGVLIGIPLEP